MKLLVFVVISLMNAIANANYSAGLFQQGSQKQKQLYTLTVSSTTADGLDHTQATYKDPEGQVVVDEKATLRGSELLRFEIDQKQLGQQGLIEVKDGKIFFSKTKDGNTKTKEEKLASTFVASANFQKFVKDQWQDLVDGKTLAFRYAVWDRQETVGFEIFKTGSEKVGEADALVLKMKPSSFIIAALVKPIFFKFAADGSRLLEMNGRVPPKQKDGSTFKDLDAEVVYTYAIAETPAASAEPAVEEAATAAAPAPINGKAKKKK